MRRQIRGLSLSSITNEIANGVYLVRVQRAHYHWHKQKPFYEIQFYVLEPNSLLAGAITARLSCSPKSLWKLGWFLRDFRYSQELLERDEIDTRALVGLQGVIQIGHEIIDGRSEVILKAFTPATEWPLIPISPSVNVEVP